VAIALSPASCSDDFLCRTPVALTISGRWTIFDFMSKEHYSVLLADDSVDDRFFLMRAITGAAPRLRVTGEVQDGEELIAYLSGQEPFGNREKYPIPDLLIMDWRMPRKDGFEVLEWLQEHPFPRLKVAVMADSSGTAHRAEALTMGASFFFSKRMNPGEVIHAVKSLQAECSKDRASP
jgi:CheY-like chemotaxis protein